MSKKTRTRKILCLATYAENIAQLRGRLVHAVDALDAALYADDNSPRLDAAERLLDELELWLDEHPLEKLRGKGAIQDLIPFRRGDIRYDVQPHKDDPEDYQRVAAKRAGLPRSHRAHRFDLKPAEEKDPDYSG